MLSRTVKWPLSDLTPQQEIIILRVSDGLREYYNWALQTQKENYEAYQAALEANPAVRPNSKKFLSEIDLYSRFVPKRAEDARDGLFQAKVPANWVLETFRASVGGYKSFFSLTKNGDHDARPPERCPEWKFQAIPGCSAFSVKGNKVVLAPEIFSGADALRFSIPEKYQAKMLERSIRIAKFVISRDERDLRRKGQYSISISYEIPLPPPVPFAPEHAVYIALGASSIGIVSPKGEKVIDLWRADTHWKPKTDAIESSLSREVSQTHPRTLTKGSKKWRRLVSKRRKMFHVMGNQQKLDRREVAASLFEYGVVTDLVVRSKDGALAGSSNPERGGSLGLNWAVQNTGTIAYLVDWLTEKVREYGGSVRKHRLPASALPHPLPDADERKILIARALRDDFLRSLQATHPV
jgi:hypothetical protein